MKISLLLPIVALAGCAESALVDEKNASIDQVAAAIAKADTLTSFHPGRWETRVTLGDFNSAAFESLIFAGLWDMESRTANASSCVLPERGARPDMALLRKVGRDCSYDVFRMGATTIEAQMTCKPSASKRVYVTLNGTYSPDNFQMYLKADAPGKNAKSERLQFSTHVDSIRNGECRGNEDIVAAPAVIEQAGTLAAPPSMTAGIVNR